MNSFSSITDKELLEVARKNTPSYIYDIGEIGARIRNFKEKLPKVRVHYAMKANRHPKILEQFKENGYGVDCASVHEAEIALMQGFDAKKIFVTQCGFSNEDLKWCTKKEVLPILGSIDEISAYIDLGLKKPVGVRVNISSQATTHKYLTTVGEYSKFGIPGESVDRAATMLKSHDIQIKLFHQNMGSGLKDVEALQRSLKDLEQLASKHRVTSVDLGGGMLPNQDLTKLSFLQESNLEIHVEPGRYFVGDAGYLVAQILAVKKVGKRTFCIVNTGMQHLIRPALYRATHPIRSLTESTNKEPMIIVGNACENGDVLSVDGEGLGEVVLGVKRGDYIVIEQAGAYCITMASQYCGYPMPQEEILHRVKAKIR